MKKTVGLACAVLLTATLGACSSSGTNSVADYCALLKSTKAEMSQLNSTSLTEAKYNTLLSKINQLQAAAPADIQDDWKTVSTKISSFHKILADAGLSLNDLPKLSSGQVPPGVDPAKLSAAVKQLQAFSADTSMQTAQTAINKEAQQKCHVSLQ